MTGSAGNQNERVSQRKYVGNILLKRHARSSRIYEVQETRPYWDIVQNPTSVTGIGGHGSQL